MAVPDATQGVDLIASDRDRWVSITWTLGRVLFWTVAVIYTVGICRRSLTLGDEGYLLSQAAAMLDGKVPYRDLDLFVTPGIWYLLAALFSVTGPQVLITRWAAGACLLATMLVSRRVVSEVGGPRWGDLGPLLIAVFSMWAFPAWSFAFYSPWATLFALAALASVLAWIRTRRAAWMFACGIGCGLCVVFKQNYGVFAAVGSALAVVIDLLLTRRPNSTLRTLAADFARISAPAVTGMLVPVIPLLVVLARAGALLPAFNSLVLRPFRGFADAHSISYLSFGDFAGFEQLHRSAGFVYMSVPMSVTDLASRWPAFGLWLINLLHYGLYWIPPFLFAALLVRAWLRRRTPSAGDRALAAITVFASLFFLGVFPRADLNHLINVYQPVLCLAAAAAAACFAEGRWRTGLLRTAGAAACAAVLFAYSMVAAAWMNDIRKLFSVPLAAPRGGVLVERADADLVDYEVETLRKLTAEGEPVMALPGLSMIPFLAERPMPTRFFNYYSVHIGFDGGHTVVDEMEKAGVRIVLANYENFFADPVGMLTYAPELTNYLRERFVPVRSIAGQTHMILERRPQPRDTTASVPLNLFCRSLAGGLPSSFGRERMLFRTIYHSFAGMWGSNAEALSICRLQVPRSGRLHVLLDLRQQDPALEAGNVNADAWLWPDSGEPQRLFATEWPLATTLDMEGPRPREFDVDLSPWEGSIVTVILRSIVNGEIYAAFPDPNRLSVTWNDGSIESPDFLEGPSLPTNSRIAQTEPAS